MLLKFQRAPPILINKMLFILHGNCSHAHGNIELNEAK